LFNFLIFLYFNKIKWKKTTLSKLEILKLKLFQKLIL
jgi:hypothetical protein